MFISRLPLALNKGE